VLQDASFLLGEDHNLTGSFGKALKHGRSFLSRSGTTRSPDHSSLYRLRTVWR